jgi:hypothetical protein
MPVMGFGSCSIELWVLFAECEQLVGYLVMKQIAMS